MEKFTTNYSMKNIPLPSRKLYLKTLTEKVEKLIKRMRWKVFHYEKDGITNDDIEISNFGFKTFKCPPQHDGLINFENDLLNLIKHITFKPARNQFQDRLREDIQRIKASDKAFVPADKSRNYYEMSKDSYEKLHIENVTKSYKKSNERTYDQINLEAKSIAKDLDLLEKVERLAKNNSFITLKDHKENFLNYPKCRLINPAKPELGKISKSIIEKVNNIVRESTKVNQWHNSNDVIKWFNNIKNKNNCTFTQFDIVEFYPSITKELLQKSLQHAVKFANITDYEYNIIMHSRKSLLFTNNELWEKKTGDPDFDVTMGSYDGAELCELVGLYILSKLKESYGIETNGLYRDDGLGCYYNINGPKSERMKKNLTKMFKDEFSLKITIETNLKTVNFLDITFNLSNNTYQPYSKPNSQPVYINVNSNHPPNIIKRIPSMISDRISSISCNKEVFDRAAVMYNDALQASGYNEKITFHQKAEKTKRLRSRKIIWFNPPYSANVRTNVAKKFLKIVNKNFPKTHPLHVLFNRNNLKVSYSCLPSMSSIISSHNKNVLYPIQNNTTKTCNCRNKNACPLNGNCLDSQVVYKCHIKTNNTDDGAHYIGLTANTFKQRWSGHNSDFRHEKNANSTRLSNHIWELKNKQITPIMSWEIIDHARPYVNGSKKCNLCLTEKYHIITSDLNLVNKRSELISKCRHVNKYLLKNYKEVPPDHSEF